MQREPALIALVGDQHHRLLAQHEGRRAAEEMHGHHRRARGDGTRAFDDGGSVGGVCLSPALIAERPKSISKDRTLIARVARAMPRMTSDDHATTVSKPLRIFSSGNWRPMKTSLLSRFSPSFQAR